MTVSFTHDQWVCWSPMCGTDSHAYILFIFFGRMLVGKCSKYSICTFYRNYHLHVNFIQLAEQNPSIMDMSLACFPPDWMFEIEQDLLVNFTYLLTLMLSKLETRKQTENVTLFIIIYDIIILYSADFPSHVIASFFLYYYFVILSRLWVNPT